MKTLKHCIPAIVLVTLLISCKTVEYIDKPTVPPLTFPAFPVLDKAERDGNGGVIVSEAWIVQIAEYKYRIEETEKNYNELKALYENEETAGAE